jgi:hypothetical protein
MIRFTNALVFNIMLHNLMNVSMMPRTVHNQGSSILLLSAIVKWMVCQFPSNGYGTPFTPLFM